MTDRETVAQIYGVLRKFLPPGKITRLLVELEKVTIGNRPFASVVRALIREHCKEVTK